MISAATIEAVRTTANIVEVVQHFVVLKKQGSSYRGFSPFNKERTPSFFVTESKGIYKDFSSGKGGDAIQFLIEAEKMTFYEAIIWLAKKYSITIEYEESSAKNDEETMRRMSYYKTLTAFGKHCFSVLTTSQPSEISEALNWLNERGYTSQEVHKFGIGYCNDKTNYQGEELQKMIDAGLVVIGQHGPYNYFSNRIVFPIRSITGKVIAYTGRTVKESPTKWLHSKNNQRFVKGNFVYGIYESRKAIIEQGSCYMVEGPGDYHAMYRSGIQNVGSSLGTGITPEQISLVARLCSKITMVYDGDKAGMKGAHNAMLIAMSLGIVPDFVFLPADQDPDSIYRNAGPEALKSALSVVMDITAALIYISGYGQTQSPAEQLASVNFCIETLTKVTDSTIRGILVTSLCSKLGLVEKDVKIQVDKKAVPKASSSDMIETGVYRETKDTRTMCEERLVALLKFQWDADVYAEFGTELRLIKVHEYVKNWIESYGLRFIDERFLGLEKSIFSMNSSAGLPAIVEYGFYERSPVMMNSVIEKMCSDLLICQIEQTVLQEVAANNLERVELLNNEIREWNDFQRTLHDRAVRIKVELVNSPHADNRR